MGEGSRANLLSRYGILSHHPVSEMMMTTKRAETNAQGGCEVIANSGTSKGQG